MRFNGSPADLLIGGDVYFGVGGLGSISTAMESNELATSDITVGLSGVPSDSIALAMTEAYQGREAILYEVALDEDWQVIPDPFVWFRGRMDQMTIEYGPTCTVTVRAVNKTADWERPRNSRYTDEEQQRLHPGDLGFQFVTSTVEKTIVWPAGSFWKNQHVD
jgi:hypothetical protein